jgi:predicted dehydrogenase
VAGEDTAAVLLHGQDGMPVLCAGTMADAGAPPLGQDRLEITGTAGRIRFDGTTLACDAALQETERWPAETIYQSGYDACLAHFAEALRTGAAFETAPEDNLRTFRLVEDVYSAAATMPSTRP